MFLVVVLCHPEKGFYWVLNEMCFPCCGVLFDGSTLCPRIDWHGNLNEKVCCITFLFFAFLCRAHFLWVAMVFARICWPHAEIKLMCPRSVHAKSVYVRPDGFHPHFLKCLYL